MTRLRAGLARIRYALRSGRERVAWAIRAPFSAARRWWDGFDAPEGQIATVGLLGLGIALGFGVSPWVGIGVPSGLLVAIALGFNLKRRGS